MEFMKKSWARGTQATVLAVLLGLPGAGALAAPPSPGALDRTVLPIPEPTYPPITELDARKATPPPRFEVKAPEGAPNVVIILLDDMGFGMSSAFGGPIHMPTVDRLAGGGLRYNQFHTTALCSPTRTALLSGRNHHTDNMGAIAEMATAFPGNTGQRPDSVAPLAEMLRLNGYSTGFFGKNHETASWETSPSGPTDALAQPFGLRQVLRLPGRRDEPVGADALPRTRRRSRSPQDPKYHFMNDMTNQAIRWMRFQKSLTPDRPFFMYFAPGATHAPHHVPKEWIAKYKGKFDQGWDAMREETLARQIKLGVVPAGHEARPQARGHQGLGQALSADEKRLFTRQMEVFAAFGEYADTEIGRLVTPLEETGEYDNTLVFYIAGRQRHERRRRHERPLQRDDLLQRRAGVGPDILKRSTSSAGRVVPAHGRRLGGCGRHAVHLDQAGRLQLRRHAQRHGRPLAEAHQGEGRDSHRSSTT